MHVRLGFSVAAHLNPNILVVDEVLSVGDAAFQKKAIGNGYFFGNDAQLESNRDPGGAPNKDNEYVKDCYLHRRFPGCLRMGGLARSVHKNFGLVSGSANVARLKSINVVRAAGVYMFPRLKHEFGDCTVGQI